VLVIDVLIRGADNPLKLLAVLGLGALPAIGHVLKLETEQLGPGHPVVRLIQPNAIQSEKWDPAMMPVFLNRQLAFTAAEAERMPDLIVWPESAIPVLLDQGEAVLEAIGRAAGEIPVVIGVQRSEGFRYYNSLAVLQRGVPQDIYDKHHLVPFGEYVPLARLAAQFGILGFAVQEEAGFSAGPGPDLISIGRLGTALPLICYEAVFPHLVGAAPGRPDVLLQITNDGWFGDFAGPQQHLVQARFRAVEQGLPMIRVANTGISAVIGPDGAVLSSLALGTAGYLDAFVPDPLSPTVYSRTGDWPVITLLLLGLMSTQIRLRSKFV
jgi:apolipoprotein N-acyltransferase